VDLLGEWFYAALPGAASKTALPNAVPSLDNTRNEKWDAPGPDALVQDRPHE
jgi:hypothetical protein